MRHPRRCPAAGRRPGTAELLNVVRLDARRWQAPADLYAALLPALGAPNWVGGNLDALFDSLGGTNNRVRAPLMVVVSGADALGPAMLACLTRVRTVFNDASREYQTVLALVTN